MGYPILRSTLARRALQKADVDASVLASTGSGWLTQVELTELVTDSAARFYDICVDVLGPETFAVEVYGLFGPSNQPPPVPLPNDFYRLVAVHVCDSFGSGGVFRNFEALEQASEQGPQITDLLNATPCDGPFFYAIKRFPRGVGVKVDVASKLMIWPFPSRERAIRVLYVPSFFRDTAGVIVDADPTYDGVDGWDHWVVLDVAIAILTKEESETGPLERERDRIEQRVRSKSGRQDSFRARVPVDMRAGGRGEASRQRWPR